MQNNNNNEIKWCTVFLCMLWGSKLLSYITAIFLRVPGFAEIATWIVPIMMVVVFMLAFNSFSKSISGNSLFFYITCALVFILTYVLFPYNADYLDEEITVFLFSALPFVFVGCAIDINRLFKPLYIISLLCVLLEAVNVLIFEKGERAMADYQYDMAAAYKLLPHMLMVLWHLMKKINIIDLIAVLLGLFLLMGYGTRGAIMCVGIFVVVYLLYCRERKWKFWSYFLIIMAVVGAVYMLNSIMEVVEIGIGRANLSSRITNAYEENLLDNDSGRGVIRDTIISAISGSPVFGLGICGDRVVTGGIYSHNIIVEFWASFGYAIGTLLLVSLIFFVYKAWRSCQTLEEKGFLMLLIAETAHLFVSSSFLHSAHLFLLIGLCYRLIHNKTITPPQKKVIIKY